MRVATTEGARWTPPARRARPGILRRLCESWTGVLGLAIVVGALAAALLGPTIAPHDPIATDFTARHEGPGADHWLGSDFLGRDNLSRVLHGARPSLFAALGVMAATVTIALGVGAVSGFGGRVVDTILMRIVDTVLAFPTLILALAVAGFLGPGLQNAIIALTAVWWAGFARIVRGQVLAVRAEPYILAAESLGAPRTRIAWRHVLPNISSPVTVLATLDIGQVILALAALSFLSLGVQPPFAEWGRMVFDAKPYMERAPLDMAAPGAAIAVTVLGFNLLGDGIRDALDPATSHGRP